MKDLSGFLLRVVYLALACAMFYYTQGGIWIGGFGVMYQYLLAIAIILLAFGVFLVQPDTPRMALTLRYSWALSAHYLWIELYSMLIWGLNLSQFNIITRGSFAVVYALIGVLTAAATVYLFGREGVRLMVGAMLMANGIYVVRAIADHGAGPFFQEYIQLILSFTSKTGSIMKGFENLNFSYMLGFFLLYQVLEALFNRTRRKKGLAAPGPAQRREWWMFPLVVACFLLGLKRSVLAAILAGLALGALLLRIPGREARSAVRALCVLLVLFGFAYVIACYYGVMDWLESLGINTSSRAHFFGQLKSYYEMGIGYFGKGAGYVSRMMQEGNLVPPENGYAPGDIHSDFLRQYIELGFFGYLVWLLLYLNYKAEFFFHKLRDETDRLHGILAMCFIVTNLVTFMTENTLYAYKLIMMGSLLTMAYHFEDYCDLEAGTDHG